MADQTQGAVDALVGLLSTAIKDEARLLGGVQGDMQFIKDEMESMNGFLLHLTKTDGEHDDQLRAWMKQVRDIAYIAQDCIDIYMRDFAGLPDKGLWSRLRHLAALLMSIPERHRLANRIRELKVRVHEVGERRLRYDVKVPPAKKSKQRSADGQASQVAIDEAREDFVRALARDKEKDPQWVHSQPKAPCFDEAIDLLDKDLREGAIAVRDGLKKCSLLDHPAATRTICMEMLLRALCAHSPGRKTAKTAQELKELVKKEEEEDNADLPGEVMVFCYSELYRSYKSCLQYLSAFRDEAAISRTSLVRRWVAEGLVEKEKQGHHSLEEAAEHCFKELLFRGFLVPRDRGTACKVKSCSVDDAIWGFVNRMSTSENFVSNLPIHLVNQLRIRKLVKRQEKQLEQNQGRREVDDRQTICGFPRPTRPRDSTMAADPMDEMVEFLKSLPQTYRLNVLDLGGCRDLRKSHLKSICNVLSLKYLSLRKTGVSRLPKQINKLKLLETLDIRQTKVRDTEHIILPKLKHLLAKTMPKEKEPLGARVPHKIRMMRDMEILSRVQVQPGHAAAKLELEEVGRLTQLRKLGVFLGGSKEAQENMKQLLHSISELSKSLRSLSVWITRSDSVQMEMNQGHSIPKLLQSLSISGLGGNTVLPRWILELEQLCKITLCDTSVPAGSLQDLGKKLRNLRCLRLRHDSYRENKLTFNEDGFQALRFLMVEGNVVTTVAFEEDGAAPMLEKIVWRALGIMEGTLSGINLLPRLEKVELEGHFSNLSSIKAIIGSKLSHVLPQ